MKTREINPANDEMGRTARIKRPIGTSVFDRLSSQKDGARRLPFCFATCLAMAFSTFVPMSFAHGSAGGHASAMGGHGNGSHNELWRQYNPFWSPSYLYHVGIYDSGYCYTPTAQQKATAKQQVEAYLLGVKNKRRPAATHRYISVETLRPTKAQLDDFARKQESARQAKPVQMCCLMVFDTQTKVFTGSGCYLVSSEPRAGEVAQFESVSAEFVGQQAL